MVVTPAVVVLALVYKIRLSVVSLLTVYALKAEAGDPPGALILSVCTPDVVNSE